MKKIKFYSIIALIIIILILAFENIAYPTMFLFFFSSINTPITMPMLIAAALGIGLGWLMRSYKQDIKDEKSEEELDSEDLPTTSEKSETPEATEIPAQSSEKPTKPLSSAEGEIKEAVEDNEIIED